VQERVEAYNFDIRKHVLEYDDVVNRQRTVVYAERRKLLSRADLHDDLMLMVENAIRQSMQTHMPGHDEEEWDLEGLLVELRQFVPLPRGYTVQQVLEADPEELVTQLKSWVEHRYQELNQRHGEAIYQGQRQAEVSLKLLLESPDIFPQTVARQLQEQLGVDTVTVYAEEPFRRLPDTIEAQVKTIFMDTVRLFRDRQIMLEQLDEHWRRHLTNLDMLREGINLRAIGQQNPLVAYQREAYEIYQDMMASVQAQIVRKLLVVPQSQTARPQARAAAPSPVLPTVARPQLTLRAGANAQNTRPQPAAGGQKPGRNDECWCGSGKKYKQCHWRSDQQAASAVPVSTKK